jgi:hypothetical protein
LRMRSHYQPIFALRSIPYWINCNWTCPGHVQNHSLPAMRVDRS